MSLCSTCGRENPPDARFCNSCAAPLAAATEPAREERKVVTVFFADLVGFTQRAEALDPEDVRALLAPYWEHVRRELERLGGTVEKFIGDAVVALFGAPVAHEDDPERAVRAALAIRGWAVDEQVQVRIAVTTGEALVRLGAHPESGEGMASGDVVNTAARLQAAAPVNGILVGEATYRATRDEIEYRRAEPVVAKGKSEPVEVWEAVDARSRFGVDVEQDARTPLVGRARELEELQTALARAREDRTPQLTTLIGVPGIGKSRLVRELFAHVDSMPDLVRWRQGRSLPYGESASFWALGEMVKAEAGILETDDTSAAEAKLAAAVEASHVEPSERERLTASLRPLVGLAGDERSGGDRRAELFAAWRRYLEALAEQTPLVLVFEDLHWSDDDLLDFVDHLVEWVADVPLLVVCTARPELLERRPGWGGGKPNARTLSLSPLRDEETARLFAVLLERALLPAELQVELLARAGGNPLYAEQYARMLVERGAGEGLAVPETVQGIIAARLDALTDEEKVLLQDAAVLGKVFGVAALQTIGGTTRERSEQLLHGLARKEFVQRAGRSSLGAESEYSFRHLLVRDVAYNQIPRAARAEKHRLAAHWVEGLQRPEDHADLLAHHYRSALTLARAAGLETGELVTAARDALAEAGDRSAALNALIAAASLYAAALELWDPDARGYADLLYRLARARHAADQPSSDVLAQARDALLAAGNIDAAAEIGARLAQAHWVAGHRDLADAHLDDALALVRDRPPSPAKAYVLAIRARFYILASELEDGIAAGAEAREMIEQLDLNELRVQILGSVGVAKIFAGDRQGGIADLQESIATAEALNLVDGARGCINLASSLWEIGDPVGAREYRERGLELARKFGSVWARVWLNAEVALDQYHAGEWDAAERTADEVIAATESMPLQMEAAARAVRGWIHTARGDAEVGRQEFARALEVGRASRDPQSLYPSLAWGAQLHLDAGRPAEAAALADELVGLMRESRSRYQPSEWGVALAFTLHQLGRADEIEAAIRARLRTRWTDAIAAIAADDLAGAADALRDVGDLPHEARLRLAAADQLAAAGRRADADRQLAAAVGFYRAVGASALIRRAEELLPATA